MKWLQNQELHALKQQVLAFQARITELEQLAAQQAERLAATQAENQRLQTTVAADLRQRSDELQQQTVILNQIQSQSVQLQRLVDREKAVAVIIDKMRRSLNLKAIFQTTVQEVRHLLKADRVSIYRFNPDWSGSFVVDDAAPGWKSLLDEQALHPELGRNVNACSIKLLAQPRSLVYADTYLQETEGGCYNRGELFRVVPDIYTCGFTDCYLELLESLQARSYAIVALYSGTELWGLLAAYQNVGPRQWQEEDISFLVQISGQLGVAVQQAELFQQVQRRSSDLQTELEAQLRLRSEELLRESERERTIAMVIDKIRRSLDIETIFHTTATEVRQLLNADRVGMFRFFPNTQCTQGEFVSEAVLPGISSALEARVNDRCFGEQHSIDYRQGKIWSSDDIEQSGLMDCHLSILSRFQVRANLVVPLLKGDDLWGLLCIHQCSGPRQWQDKEKEFVQQIAVQLGVALQQAELFSQAQTARDAADAANQAKSEFLANMSHELRTPLNAILGFAQVMLRDPALQTEQREHLEIIGRSGEHLLSLINDVLEMSKIEAGQLTLNESSFDLYRLLSSLQDMLDLKAESKALQLIFERLPQVPQYIQADESKLRQILINLLGNALKFTDKGQVILRIDYEGNWLRFEVHDTGPGIAPEEIDRLFESFVQTETGRRSQEGTGLGLPISRRFARLMGGDIQVQSTLGVGSQFTCRVPIDLAEPTQVQTAEPRCRVIGLAPGQPAYRILIVEDKFANRQLMVKLLKPLGFEVREATNGQEAIALWREWQPHLIWMDMRMPIMDGYTATRIIKSESQERAADHPHDHPPIILALTANAFEEERMIALAIGCDDFIRKPCQEELLLNKMAEYLGVEYCYAGVCSPLPKPGPEVDAMVNPMTPAASSAIHAVANSASIPPGFPLKILVAEDNLLNQKLALQMLKHLGYSAMVVSNGLEVLAALQREFFDVVLMDVQMPEMDGLSAARQIVQTYPLGQRPYLIAMTGNTLDSDREDCHRAGMNDYLSKPVKLEALRAALQRCLPHFAAAPESSKVAPLASVLLDPLALESLRQSAGEAADDFLREMIDCYLQDAPPLLQQIQTSLAQGSIAALERSSHTLKSISATLGAKTLAQQCWRLEQWAKGGSLGDQMPEALQRLTATLTQEYDQVLVALQQERQRLALGPAVPEKYPPSR